MASWCIFTNLTALDVEDKELEVVQLVLAHRVDADPVVLVVSLGPP